MVSSCLLCCSHHNVSLARQASRSLDKLKASRPLCSAVDSQGGLCLARRWNETLQTWPVHQRGSSLSRVSPHAQLTCPAGLPECPESCGTHVLVVIQAGHTMQSRYGHETSKLRGILHSSCCCCRIGICTYDALKHLDLLRSLDANVEFSADMPC